MALTSCFCCISLRTGSFIFTVISALNCFSAFINNFSSGGSDLIIYGEEKCSEFSIGNELLSILKFEYFPHEKSIQDCTNSLELRLELK